MKRFLVDTFHAAASSTPFVATLGLLLKRRTAFAPCLRSAWGDVWREFESDGTLAHVDTVSNHHMERNSKTFVGAE